MGVKPLLLSVVIPTHNRPRSLPIAVASILNQTELSHEIIVVDDGSDPPVDPRIFGDSPIPIRVVRNERAQGAASARNSGVNGSTGEFVAFLDDDDTWVPWKVEAVARCFSIYPEADIALHQTGHGLMRRDDEWWQAVGNPLERMLYRQPPHIDGVVVRRALHEESPLDERFAGAEDLDYLIRLAKSGAQVVETSAVLAIYGSDATTVIGTDARIRGRLELLDRHPEILGDRRALAFFNMRLGHQYRRDGQRWNALASFGRSLTARPSPSAAKGVLLSLLTTSMQNRLTQ